MMILRFSDFQKREDNIYRRYLQERLSKPQHKKSTSDASKGQSADG